MPASNCSHILTARPIGCLDHVNTNKPDTLSAIAVNRNGGSDHRVIYFTRYAKSVVRKHCFKNFDVAGIRREVA